MRRPLALLLLPAIALAGCNDGPLDGRGVAVGLAHSCRLDADGEVQCWGTNRLGELGRGAVSDREPTPEPVALPGPALAVDAGGNSGCAILAEGRAVWCWGHNHQGQLGDGTRDARPFPAPVPGLPPARDLAVGHSHVCMAGVGGAVWCWGWNPSGGVLPGGPPVVETPVRVLERGATTVTAGFVESCATMAEGPLRCWGEGLDGITDRVPEATGAVIGAETTCGLGPNEVRCFGRSPGNIGFARELEEAGEAFPLRARGGSRGGLDHLCVLLEDRTVRCWGRNDSGQLGDGSLVWRQGPTPQPDLRGVRSLGAGSDHTCAQTATETYCWGANDRGQLGDGTFVISLSPVLTLP